MILPSSASQASLMHTHKQSASSPLQRHITHRPCVRPLRQSISTTYDGRLLHRKH